MVRISGVKAGRLRGSFSIHAAFVSLGRSCRLALHSLFPRMFPTHRCHRFVLVCILALLFPIIFVPRVLIADNTLQLVMVGESESELAPHGEGNVYAPEIHREGARIWMWYGGQGTDGHDRIHLAESDDGAHFVKRGVVIDRGTANHVNDPTVVRVRDRWWMFYTVAETAEDDQIAAAVSQDGLRWEQQGVVVQPGGPSAWDSRKVGRPAVLHQNGVFRMWYDGQPTRAAVESDEVAARVAEGGRAVGYAESQDGLRWTKRAEPVMYEGAGAVHVTWIDQRYVMTGESRRGVWWAESNDGLEWQRRGWLSELSGEASDRFGQVTPFLWPTADRWWLYFGAAARTTWDGNRIARMSVAP
jgi:sucrose-6-phosphate hydrolase SacC (GH32 family)